MKRTLHAAICVALVATVSHAQENLIVRSGQTVTYDTGNGTVRANNLTVERGGVLRVTGSRPFVVQARGHVLIEGLISLDGASARNVSTLNMGSAPEVGASGTAGGGMGGTASAIRTASTPAGIDGATAGNASPFAGGRGGETGHAGRPQGEDARRPGGGGGGALGPNQPRVVNPSSPRNQGLLVQSGFSGHPLSTGAQSGRGPARGGPAGWPIVVDADPRNDFWGLKPDPSTGLNVRGELTHPLAGSGGGAGGDAVPSGVFPHPNWTTSTDEKGGAGGGGGGLAFLIADEITFGPAGELRANGGRGAAGENTFFINQVGGGGGGGSGGFLILRAHVIDLSAAGSLALRALGGAGGTGQDGVAGAVNAGGNGGPGFIQLHTPGARGVILPSGMSMSDLSSPTAHSLLQRTR